MAAPLSRRTPGHPATAASATFAHPGDPPSLDPYHTTSYLAHRVAGTTYDRLVESSPKVGTDPYNNPKIPGLAESWEVSDDFLTYTFHLRKGVRFHNLPPVNGREMDAEDVKATFTLYMDPGSIIKAAFASVDRVEVVDLYTVALHMKEVEPQMLLTLAEPIRGSIMPREMTDPTSHARRRGGIGTGPFMVDKEYEFKVGITYKRNPDYWQFDEAQNRLPYLDGRKIAVIPDANARLTAFRTGKIDFGAEVTGGVIGMRAFMKASPTTLVQEYLPIPGGSCWCLRLDREPWSDVRVRRALSLALDYETISQTLSGQSALVMQGVIPGALYGSDDRLTTVTRECGCPWYSYDPQRAKALLAEAGFPNGFSTDLAFFAYSQSTIETAELLAAYWKAIGVDVKLLSQDYTIFRRNVDLGGWENIGSSFLCCGSTTVYSVTYSLILGGAKNPQMGFINDPKLTPLAKEIIASYKDEARQKKLLREANAYYRDQVFTINTGSGTGSAFFSPRLRNFQPFTNLFASSDYRQVYLSWIDDDWSFAK